MKDLLTNFVPFAPFVCFASLVFFAPFVQFLAFREVSWNLAPFVTLIRAGGTARRYFSSC